MKSKHPPQKIRLLHHFIQLSKASSFGDLAYIHTIDIPQNLRVIAYREHSVGVDNFFQKFLGPSFLTTLRGSPWANNLGLGSG